MADGTPVLDGDGGISALELTDGSDDARTVALGLAESLSFGAAVAPGAAHPAIATTMISGVAANFLMRLRDGRLSGDVSLFLPP